MKKLQAKNEFIVGKNYIAWIGSNFKEHFLPMSFMQRKEKLESKTLSRHMLDKEILDEFKPQAVELGDVLYALSYLDHDHDSWYIFYVNDDNGTLCVVDARWYADSGGWNVGARSVEDPFGWEDVDQVLSRDFGSEKLSDLESLEKRVAKLESLFSPELLNN